MVDNRTEEVKREEFRLKVEFLKNAGIQIRERYPHVYLETHIPVVGDGLYIDISACGIDNGLILLVINRVARISYKIGKEEVQNKIKDALEIKT